MNKDNFQSSDILWIKSVTRSGGSDWAYTEYKVGDTFTLHFSKNPKWYPTNYEKAKPGELIALFQRISGDVVYKEGWYVTHLVTPLDYKVSKVANNPDHPYIRLVAVIANLTEYIPVDESEWSLYNCNRGQICGIDTVKNKNSSETSPETKRSYIWNLFSDIETDLYQDIYIDELPLGDDVEVEEGAERTKLKNHKYRERNPFIIKEAKRLAKLKGEFKCCVCDFNFEHTYMELGIDFIECHHKTPIATGGVRKTKVSDLALVCSNCHRMLHRKNKEGNYLGISELRDLIHQNLNR